MAEDFNPGVTTDAQAQTENTQASTDPAAADKPNDTVNDTTVKQEELLVAASKPKNKAELEAENELLRTENERLALENETLKRMLPSYIQPRPGYKVVFIKSDKVAAIVHNGRKHIEGAVNGVKFMVPCDMQTEVPDAVAEALAGVISAQR